MTLRSMKEAIRRYLTLYSDSWWRPTVLFLILLVAFAVTAFAHYQRCHSRRVRQCMCSQQQISWQ